MLKFDPSTTTVRLKYTEAALMKLSQKCKAIIIYYSIA